MKKTEATRAKEFKGFYCIDDIQRLNESIGHHWFSKDTMRWFKCRLDYQVFNHRFFISSEKSSHDAPRLYSVRMVNSDGSIETIGEFQQFKTLNKARKFASGLDSKIATIIDLVSIAFNRGKYCKQVRSYINKNIDLWDEIKENNYVSEWLSSWIDEKVMTK